MKLIFSLLCLLVTFDAQVKIYLIYSKQGETSNKIFLSKITFRTNLLFCNYRFFLQTIFLNAQSFPGLTRSQNAIVKKVLQNVTSLLARIDLNTPEGQAILANFISQAKSCADKGGPMFRSLSNELNGLLSDVSKYLVII